MRGRAALWRPVGSQQARRLLTSVVAASLAILGLSSPIATAQRVYELVAPEHQGFPGALGPVFGASNPGVWVDPKGGRIAYGAVDAFVGDSGLISSYVSMRGPAGWFTQGLYPQMPSGGGLSGPVTSAIAGDYSRVVLKTLAPLDQNDVNGLNVDTYLWEPSHNTLTWVSRSDEPGSSYYVGRSADAHRLIFSSVNNLVPAATGDSPKLYEWVDGSIQLVSVMPDGSAPLSGAALGTREEIPGTKSSRAPNAVSRDGLRIFFSSPPPSSASAPEPTRLYARVNDSTTVEVSKSQCTRVDCNAPANISFAGATPDGEHVYFSTTQQLVNADTDGRADLYEYSFATQSLARLSEGLGITELSDIGGSYLLGLANDGAYLYYRNASEGLTLWHDGVSTVVAPFISDTTQSGTQDCNQTDLGGQPDAPADGRALLFETDALTAFGSGSAASGLYLYTVADHTLRRLASNGTTAPNNPFNLSYLPDCGLNTGFVSDSDVFFSTADPLVPQDVNGALDVYEWHAGQVALVSAGVGGGDSRLLGVSQGGDDVFFITNDQLVNGDSDHVQDIYDARSDGAHPDPVAVPGLCEGDDCQLAQLAQSANGDAAFTATSLFHGHGNRHAQYGVRKVRVAKRVQRGRVGVGAVVIGRGMLVVRARVRINGTMHVFAVRRQFIAAAETIELRLPLSVKAAQALEMNHQLHVVVTMRLANAGAKRARAIIHD
jgi:hypothetical protein